VFDKISTVDGDYQIYTSIVALLLMENSSPKMTNEDVEQLKV
jgi:hypothetical protein